jgi:hypothetical protein
VGWGALGLGVSAGTGTSDCVFSKVSSLGSGDLRGVSQVAVSSDRWGVGVGGVSVGIGSVGEGRVGEGRVRVASQSVGVVIQWRAEVGGGSLGMFSKVSSLGSSNFWGISQVAVGQDDGSSGARLGFDITLGSLNVLYFDSIITGVSLWGWSGGDRGSNHSGYDGVSLYDSRGDGVSLYHRNNRFDWYYRDYWSRGLGRGRATRGDWKVVGSHLVTFMVSRVLGDGDLAVWLDVTEGTVLVTSSILDITNEENI